ncbi:hypothetical protein [Zobellia laminariae]|uniref:hypothetical protein n=1 Tax=Zobellia laminariae TaxID=248906 RepID=UPI004055D9FE
MKKLVSVIVFVIANSLFSQSVTIPKDQSFYNPDIKPYHRTIKKPNHSNNHSQLIQDAIDEIEQKGGGILTIEAGNNNIYIINEEIRIKSNVHIKVNPNVIFKSTSPRKIAFFSAGKYEPQRVTNFSLTSTDAKKYFTFDFLNRPAGKKITTKALTLGGVQNFKVSNFIINDNSTPHSGITVNLLEVSKKKYLFAKDGIIENIKITNSHYGYGLVQCQAAENVLYRNLIGEGGATLRLETGAIGKPYLADKSIIINNVYGKNIVCKNGQAAVTLSPHTIKNGKVFIDDLTADSCEAGAIVAAGFLSAKKEQRDKKGNAINGHTYGYFDANSVISNLKVIYGTNAQLRPSRRPFVPCAQRNLISTHKNPDQESYTGPTIAGIIYFAKGGTRTDRGFYTVKTPGLELKNFPLVNGQMENKEFVASTKEFLTGCDKN